MDEIAPEAVRAIALAFYALHDTLVEKGVLEPGETAASLRRFGPATPEDAPDLATLMAHIGAVAGHLEKGIFRTPDAPGPGPLRVIPGGKA